MLNKKGQALVEFVLILPVLIMLILGVIDFGRVLVLKNELENKSNLIEDFLSDNLTYEEIYNKINPDIKATSKVDIDFDYGDDGYVKVVLSKNVDMITPGISLIVGKPYKVEVKRVFRYE